MPRAMHRCLGLGRAEPGEAIVPDPGTASAIPARGISGNEAAMSGQSAGDPQPRRMHLFERLHLAYDPARRCRVLCDLIAPRIPHAATVLDVGCGDGALLSRLAGLRSDVDSTGIDVMARADAAIPVEIFDGVEIPFGAGAFDVVLLIDVLHHSDDPEQVLREAARVARRRVLVKDHVPNGPFGAVLLRFMDDVANRRVGLKPVPHEDYWPAERWREVFDRCGLAVEMWSDRLHLYPRPIDWVFGRSLHFVAELRTSTP
jgi:SAM-dependent methyltransferase